MLTKNQKSAIFETIQVLLLAGVVLIGIFWITDSQRFTALEEDLAVQDQLIAELQQAKDDLENRMAIIEGRNVLLIANTGRKVVIETLGGQELRCYFPE